MRGRRLKGYINNGEWIEVQENWKAEGLLEPKRVMNLTTASWVEVSGPRSLPLFVQLLFLLLFGGAFFAVFFFVLAGILWG
jgi:hypothetical protein